jgi:cytochrome c
MEARMRGKIGSAVALLLSFQAAHAATDAGDPKRGAQGFRACVACHSVAPGEHMTGPSLAKAWNHKAGAAEGFTRYSEPMKRLEAKWDERTLDKWLADPERFLPGTTMTFPGIKDAKARRDVIAYLKAVAEEKAPPAPAGGGGMMGMTRSKADLSQAPAEAQVKSIRRCNDTYTVETADGKTQKVWEFNLRFKTDSSKLGPRPGQPVAVGAGMQGDRASIVFASPKEISEFIQVSCP